MKFVVMRSGFGDYWVAKTSCKLPKTAKALNTFEEAKEKALQMNDSIENQEELEDIVEEDIEIVKKDMLRWLA